MSIELDEYLNTKTDGKFDFKLKSAKLSKTAGLCFVEMFYKDGVILSQDKRIECENILKDVLPSGFVYNFKFIKNFLTKDALSLKAKEFFIKNHPSISFEISDVCVDKENKLTLMLEEKQKDYIIEKHIIDNFKEYLKQSFNTEIQVFVLYNENLSNEEELPFESLIVEDQTPKLSRTIEVSNLESIVGEMTDTSAYYIKDKTLVDEEVVFCGNISYFKEYSYTPKKKPKEEKSQSKTKSDDFSENADKAEESENKNERKYFKFAIKDFTGEMNCVFFANKNNVEIMQTLKAGDSVIVSGKLEEDKFNGGVSLRVKEISKCTLPEKFEEEIVWKNEPKNYQYVLPEQMVYYAQTDLFSMGEQVVPEKLLNKEFVVFDFETTGLQVSNGDKIIEIGAVKVSNGKITERFECMVNPEMHIPADSSKVNGIFDDDVKDAYTYDKVLQDFYKFTRNTTLVGYNVMFDYGFLSFWGKKCGYNFDNPLLDVYKLAQIGVKGTKNYKLKTIAEKLGVNLDNAHRAVYDAIATAEVFLKLTDFMD